MIINLDKSIIFVMSNQEYTLFNHCLLYTSDAADE